MKKLETRVSTCMYNLHPGGLLIVGQFVTIRVKVCHLKERGNIHKTGTKRSNVFFFN